MSEIDLGHGDTASFIGDGVIFRERGKLQSILTVSEMDALCKWWLEQRASVQLLEIAALAVAKAAAKEQQVIEAHKAGRSRPISEIISDLRKEQPE